MKKRVIVCIVCSLCIPAAIFVGFVLFRPDLLVAAAFGAERRAAGLSMKSIQVDDHRIAYLDGGAGEPMLLLHGYAAEKDHWIRYARHFTGSYRVVIPDVPGFGESTRNWKARYDIMTQVARLKRFADLLGLRRIHIAGNSMGGALAAQFAATYPELVRSVVLMDSHGVTAPKQNDFMRDLAQGKNRLDLASPADFNRLQRIIFVRSPWIPFFAKGVIAGRLYEARPFNEKVMSELRKYPAPLEPVLGRIPAPVLVLWGDSDQILDRSSIEVFRKKLPTCAVSVLPQCGHSPMLEQPAISAARVSRFMATVR